MKIEILGKPIPLARARVSTHRFYDPQFEVKKHYANEVLEQFDADLMGPYRPMKNPIRLNLDFRFQMPKAWSKKKKERLLDQPHQGKIDLDNLIKFIGDSLNTLIWVDDSQIWNITAKKTWALEAKTVIDIS